MSLTVADEQRKGVKDAGGWGRQHGCSQGATALQCPEKCPGKTLWAEQGPRLWCSRRAEGDREAYTFKEAEAPWTGGSVSSSLPGQSTYLGGDMYAR